MRIPKITAAIIFFILLVNLLSFVPNAFAAPVTTQQSTPITETISLQLDQPLNGSLDGQNNVYQISAKKDQFLQIAVEPKGVDIVVKVIDVNRQETTIDNYGDKLRAEYICLIAPADGDYLINILPAVDKARGDYRIGLIAVREAKPADRDIVSALELAAAARLLRKAGDKQSLQDALAKYQQASELLKDKLLDRVRADLLCYTGELHYALDNYPLVGALFEQSLALSQSADYRYGQACALIGLGNINYWLNQYPQSLDYFNRAIALCRELKDAKGESSALLRIGQLNLFNNKYTEALDYFNQSLAIARAAGERENEASSFASIGLLHLFKSEYQQSIDNYTRALEIRRELKDLNGQVPYLHGLSSIYGTLGDRQRAMDYIQQALTITRSTGSRSQETFELTVLGDLYLANGEYQKSLECLLRAVTLTREIGTKSAEANSLTTLGELYLKINEHQKALDCFNQALELRKKLDELTPLSIALNLLGDAYTALNQFPQAIDYYQQALKISEKIDFTEGKITNYYGLAVIASKENRLAEARSDIEKVLAITESVRGKIDSEKDRAGYLSTLQKYYNLYIDLLMRLHELNPKAGYDEMALRASEKARARSLLETLSEQLAELRHGADQTLIDEESSIQQQINGKALTITRLLGKVRVEEKDQQQADALETEIRALTQQLFTIKARIKQANPRYAALTQPQPLTLKEIQQQLDPETVLLEYSLGDERSYLWLVTHDAFYSYKLTNKSEIEQTVKQFRDLLLTRTTIKDRTGQGYEKQVATADLACQRTAKKLGEMLLSAAAAQLPGKRLIIVADGVLNYLPFAALSLAKKQSMYAPLMLKHEIINLPSASVIALLRQENGRHKTATKSIAIFADPVFARTDNRYLQLARQNEPEQRTTVEQQVMLRSADENGYPDYFRRLNYSNVEARSIMSFVDAADSKLAIGFQANKPTAISEELSNYRYIHFATHGILNNREPELSALVLSLIDEQGIKQDGYLRLHEIFNLNISAEMVVLSACQTGLGKEVKGEGLIGLTRGFMYAGAPRIVASLWQVDDAGTAQLMKRFYQGILGSNKQTPAAALRAAQIALFQQKEWHAPFFWAAFTLQGEYK